MSWADTAALRQALYAMFPGPAHAVLEEVRNGTGFARGRTRTADALVMSTWPSRGLWLAGVELKSSRSDWLKEKDEPDKADGFFHYCDFWWLAVSDEKIVQDGELPEAWGLLFLGKNGKLLVKKPAPRNLAPKTMDRLQLAAIMRRISEDYVPSTRLNELVEAKLKEKEAILTERVSFDLKHTRDELAQLQASLREFEQRSGLTIQTYTGANLGDAVARLRHFEGNGRGLAEILSRVEDQLVGALDRVRAGKEIAAAPAASAEPPDPTARSA